MALTKTQINYLEQKLRRAAQEKIDKYRAEHKNETIAEVTLRRLQAGDIKLLPKAELLKMFEETINGKCNYYYNPNFTITDFISSKDLKDISEEVATLDERRNTFTQRINDVVTNALDKIVLEGVDVETAMEMLNSIE